MPFTEVEKFEGGKEKQEHSFGDTKFAMPGRILAERSCGQLD